MPDNTHSPGGVFLSYAREDTNAAKRIAEAMRAFGVDAWFDQSELRGGDAWDAKIKKQIRECALFLPIISATTQARGEGYFRREWKMAVERTHDMAASRVFVLPVVIDDTPEAGAEVPEEFMRVQWTRLQHGAPTPEFIAQVKRLIDTPRKPSLKPDLPRPPTLPPEFKQAARKAEDRGQTTEVSAAGRKSGLPGWVWAVAAVVLVAVGAGVVFLRQPAAPAKTAEKSLPPPASSLPPSTASAVADKSIAVLPFTNMSEEKDNAFFTDGVHEDIVTNLALIRDLKVVSRTTVIRYRDSKKSVREIGEELGVAYILEGSVRRAGNKVRVTGQLIKTRTDEHVWAKAYDRDLTDIFAIQAALAQEIAGALEAAISPQAQKQITRRPTDNPVAYDLYLRGRDTRNRAPTASPEALIKAEQFFQGAVDLDPNFAAAWGELAVVHALKVFWEQDGSPARLARADAAAANARRLAPEAPDVIRLDGTYAYYAYRDYTRATGAYRRIIEHQPNDATGYGSLALILRRQGRWAESIETIRRAVELDPSNISYQRSQLSTFSYVRRFAEARPVQQRILQLLPGDLREQYLATLGEASATGDFGPFERFVANLTPEQRDTPLGRYARKFLAVVRNDYAAFRAVDDPTPFIPEFEQAGISLQVTAAMHLAHGQPELARQAALRLHAEADTTLATQPRNVRTLRDLSGAHAFLGRSDEALRVLAQVDEILPESRDPIDAVFTRLSRAYVLGLAGRKQEAVDELARFLARPNAYGVNYMRVDTLLRHTLGGFAPYEALLADPKNNQPLF